MKTTAKVQKNEETGELYLSVEEFKDFVDISKVVSYNIELITTDEKTEAFILRFYDNNNKELPFSEEKC